MYPSLNDPLHEVTGPVLVILSMAFPLLMLWHLFAMWRAEGIRLLRNRFARVPGINLHNEGFCCAKIVVAGAPSVVTGGLRWVPRTDGLYLEVMELMFGQYWSILSTISVPWEYVACTDRSKFGFFDAQLRITGFENDQSLEITVTSTSLKMKEVIRQCLEASKAEIVDGLSKV